jgi:hypothetical protein
MSSKLSLSMLMLAGLLVTGCQAGVTDGNLYGYDFDTSRISYQISGSSTGTSDVLIKGEKKFVHNKITQTMVSGETVEMDNIFIQNGPKLYTLDAKTKTGTSLTTPLYGELQKLAPAQRAERLLRDALRDDRPAEEQAANPLKPEKNETIAGQTCNLYRLGNLTTCLWQGIPLRTVASLPDYAVETTTLATKVEINQPIDDSEFDVPQEYQITELN